MTRRAAGIHSGCILLCALMAAAGPKDVVLDEAASVDDIERLEQAVYGPDEQAPESEMRWRVAWALLSTGRDRAAMRQFARLAGREPDAGGPKIGYALSAARVGDLTNAARAMRRVLRVDPDALADVPMDEALYAQVETLRTQYMKRLARFDHDRDGAVMLAAVCYLLGETESARYAIGYLTANGDRSATTENLDRLIDDLANPPASEVVEAVEVVEAPGVEPLAEAPTEAPADTPAEALARDTAPAPPEPIDEPGEEPLDFTLVFRDDQATDPDTTPAISPVPVPMVVTATVGDPWAPAAASSLNVPAPAPKPVPFNEVPERYQVDYDKLRDDLGSVGGALDTFTQKLIRNIAALKKE